MPTESPSRSTVLRAASTEERSSARIRRSRGASLMMVLSGKLLRHFNQTARQRFQCVCLPCIFEIVQIVKSSFSVWHNDLLGNDQRATTKFQHLTQGEKPARATKRLG